jgi:signal transduction histidine kinase
MRFPATVRGSLAALFAAAALPLLAFALVQAVAASLTHRRAIEDGLLNTARALSGAVEEELRETRAALQALATSTALDEPVDLAAFREEARRVQSRRPWCSLWLAQPDGRRVVQAPAPDGLPLPSLESPLRFEQVARTGRAAVSGLSSLAPACGPMVAVAVPVQRGGKTPFVLAAGLSAATLSSYIDPGRGIPAGGLAAIVDADWHVVARSREAERWIGRDATADYIERVRGGQEGVFRSVTLDGQPVLLAFRAVAGAGWSLSVGAPADVVEAPLRLSVAATLLAAAAVTAVAAGSALAIARRITVPMAVLTRAAHDLAAGKPPQLPPDGNLAEVHALSRALSRAADAMTERDGLAARERELMRALEAAESRERQQIARDLHDDLAQTLAAAQIRLSALRGHPDPEVAASAAGVGRLVDVADRSVRSLAEQLSPPVLHELGLGAALEWLADEIGRHYGMEVELRGSVPDDALPKAMRSSLYRAVRELLLNAARHAGVMHASVIMRRTPDDRLEIVVLDAGVGYDPATQAPGRTLGLHAVDERMRLLNGRLDVESAPGAGTRATLSVPLPAGAGG